MDVKQALVVGSSGLLGLNFLQRLSALPGWSAIGLSRRRPAHQLATRQVSLDLLDVEACARELPRLRDVTHVFYLARAVESNYTIKVQPNVDMLKNLVDALEGAGGRLQHIQLMHGLKWYGSHLGPFKSPAEESDPRPRVRNFYYEQADYIADRQRGTDWTWSALRPHFICGVAVGSPSNIMSAVGTYATILRELGLPLRFPGSEPTFSANFTYTDVNLLTRAMVWAATDARAANDAFNIVNGDSFRWRDVWPDIAAHYGMDAGTAQGISLVEFMRDKEPVWQAAVRRHGLQPNRFADVADWAFADSVFGATWDQTASAAKAHRHGFAVVQDTRTMLTGILGEYRRQRILP
ncbi:MAG: SDR family oxidoreductase [Rhodospirillales bacterium]|nr:SDR family oxidoreductase [Rhodospirillales bacterium]